MNLNARDIKIGISLQDYEIGLKNREAEIRRELETLGQQDREKHMAYKRLKAIMLSIVVNERIRPPQKIALHRHIGLLHSFLLLLKKRKAQRHT